MIISAGAHMCVCVCVCVCVSQILTALTITVLHADESLTQALGASLWQRFSDVYVIEYVSRIVAASAQGDSSRLYSVQEEAAGLEGWAREAGLTDGELNMSI